MEKPVLTNYLNVLQFLQDLYTYRRSQDSDFSYTSWSHELNLKSRSYLRMVVVGKRGITEAFVTTFALSMDWSPADKEYFQNLVHHSQSRSPDQKKFYARKLMQSMNAQVDRHHIENYYDFFSSPLNVRLLTLLSFHDIPKNKTYLSSLLEISEEKVNQSLEQLEKMDLAVRAENAEDIVWQTKNKLHKLPEQLGNPALAHFHDATMKDAIQAQKKPFQERRFRSLFLPFNTEEYSEFLHDLEDFIQQSLAKFQSNELEGRKLFQVNFNNFTVTKSPEGVEK